MTDLEKTKHYSKKSELLLRGLKDFVPKDAILVEPFAGELDLVNMWPSADWELYDIEPKGEEINERDSLLNPPDYTGRWIITNPPFLAKNKAKDKTLFELYGFDDFYKIALHTFIGCKGGIVIVPLNFFVDEGSRKIREEFLSSYKVDRMNVFGKPMFTSTTYSVCAFAFHKEQNESQSFNCYFDEIEKDFQMNISAAHGYRYGGEWLDEIEKVIPKFSRLVEGKMPNGQITKMKLTALDTRLSPIGIDIVDEPYCGKQSDRIYATLVSEVPLTERRQRELAVDFNEALACARALHYNLLFTNYRDYNRKRIGFDFAYKLLTKLLEEK